MCYLRLQMFMSLVACLDRSISAAVFELFLLDDLVSYNSLPGEFQLSNSLK